MMSNQESINLGAAIFTNIDYDPYLNELYDNLLYNYSIKLFNLKKREKKLVNIEDALRFADILSKSTDCNKADKHKIMAQEIVALLRTIEPEHPAVEFYLGSVLSSTGNYRGMAMATPNYRHKSLLDWFYAEFSKNLLSIPAEPEYQFFRSQKAVYDRLNEPYFSYSGPTSMGKSFIMRMYIKKQIMDGIACNFAILVPTKALINEVTSRIINDLKELLAEQNYRLVTSAGALSLKQDHNFIFVLTPERLLYLLIDNPHIEVDYLFIDEAHKISSKGPRSTFYYKVVDMLCQRAKKPKVIFASPNIPNPEVYLKLIPGAEAEAEQRLATTFAPVSQIKYLIDFPSKEIQLFNTYSGTLTPVANIHKEPTFCQLIWRIGKNTQNIIYCSGTDKAVGFAREFAEDKPQSDDKDLLTLAQDIKNEVHGDYYLADVISKGVAYHIGYLPATIRMRIEELFRKGLIHTMFCTSTLVEGVNLPADNLFITHYKNGLAKMTSVDFKNLIGRVLAGLNTTSTAMYFLSGLKKKLKLKNF
jgi:replicative superfamily II helicase